MCVGGIILTIRMHQHSLATEPPSLIRVGPINFHSLSQASHVPIDDSRKPTRPSPYLALHALDALQGKVPFVRDRPLVNETLARPRRDMGQN